MNHFHFFSYLKQCFFGILSLITPQIVKTNPKRIVLTSFHGKGYRGNTKVIFEQLVDHPYFQPVWLSTDRIIVANIRGTYGEKYANEIHSFKGLLLLGQSAATLFTHGTSDFPFIYIPRSSVRIQTYHGLPTKKGEFLRPNDQKPGFFHTLILNYRFKPISYFLSSSPIVTEIYASRFGLPKNRFLEIGYPAYDELIHRGISNKNVAHIWPEAPESEHLILYAPTFRKKNKTKWFPFEDYDIYEIADFLEKNNTLLALRSHPNETLQFDNYQKISARFVNASQKQVEDINTLIKLCDVILTDYSSVYIEGLLRDIPAIFIPYDIESYERGNPLPYERVTPGPKVSTQTQLLESLLEAINYPKAHSDERKRVKNLFFSNSDGFSTDRLIRFLEDKLKK